MLEYPQQKEKKSEVSDEELLQVIADFLEMGHVENIVAMFHQDPRYFAWTHQLLTDERFAVRLGVSVLFEYLKERCPELMVRAIPGLITALGDSREWVRGEAAKVLGIIGTPEALAPLPALLEDDSSQVVEIVRDILGLQ